MGLERGLGASVQQVSGIKRWAVQHKLGLRPNRPLWPYHVWCKWSGASIKIWRM